MEFAYSAKSLALAEQLKAFIADHVFPVNRAFHEEHAAGRYPLRIINGPKARARAAGLWNI